MTIALPGIAAVSAMAAPAALAIIDDLGAIPFPKMTRPCLLWALAAVSKT